MLEKPGWGQGHCNAISRVVFGARALCACMFVCLVFVCVSGRPTELASSGVASYNSFAWLCLVAAAIKRGSQRDALHSLACF